MRVLPRPIFNISPDGSVATSLDFIRLNRGRPGELRDNAMMRMVVGWKRGTCHPLWTYYSPPPALVLVAVCHVKREGGWTDVIGSGETAGFGYAASRQAGDTAAKAKCPNNDGLWLMDMASGMPFPISPRPCRAESRP